MSIGLWAQEAVFTHVNVDWDRDVLWVELPVQRRLCPIFVRHVGSPDIHECFRGLTGSQRTPGICDVTLSLLIARDVKVEVQAGIGISSSPLKGKLPRNLLSTGLVPQSSYNFVLLSNQSYLLMEVPGQPTTLLSQAFRRVYNLGNLTTSPVQ